MQPRQCTAKKTQCFCPQLATETSLTAITTVIHIILSYRVYAAGKQINIIHVLICCHLK